MMIPVNKFRQLHKIYLLNMMYRFVIYIKGWYRSLHGEKSNLKLVELQHIYEILVREKKVEPIGL